MKLLRLFLAVATVGGLAGLAFVAQQAETAQQTVSAGGQMIEAAEKFLAGLSDDQKKTATFGYDDAERTNWNFIPLQTKERKSTRKGLPLENMSDAQKKLALGLLKSGTSEKGYRAANDIMGLEKILKVQEADKGAMVRNPEWYFVTIFGTPSKTGKWGWRFEGHHLSMNFTLEGAQVVSATPRFFGANPAVIKTGPRQGEKVLPGVEDLAIELYKSLDGEQQKVALQPKKFGEPVEKSKSFGAVAPVGLAAGKMTQAQKDLLLAIVRENTDRMAPDIAAREAQDAAAAGIEKFHFAYTGSTEAGKGKTYRVQGPSFVVEFINEQADAAGNPANHIHNASRLTKGDFGLGR